jgi:hypothetical protein
VLLRYLVALALTLAVEVPLGTLALRYGCGIPTWRAARLCVAVNLATHPVLWWGLALGPAGSAYPLMWTGAEVAACAVEWALLRWRIGRDTALLAVIAVGTNAASVAAGLLVTTWGAA